MEYLAARDAIKFSKSCKLIMHCFVKETRNSNFQHRLFAYLINGWSLLLKTLKWILDIVLSRSSCAISVDLIQILR